MITVSIARRYAKALLELAVAQNQAEPVGQALDTVAHAFGQSPELRDVMANPAFTTASRQAILAKLVEAAKMPTLAANTLKLLVERGRGGYIEAVAREYRGMLDQKAGRVRARITTAVPLDDASVEKIRGQLAAVTQKQVSVERTVDPQILGGVVAQVGSLTFDGSLQTQLSQLRRQMLS